MICPFLSKVEAKKILPESEASSGKVEIINIPCVGKDCQLWVKAPQKDNENFGICSIRIMPQLFSSFFALVGGKKK